MSVDTNTPPAATVAETPAAQTEIKVSSRRFTLKDFLKTCVQIGGSDIHLQAASVPMIRVDGKARFLDCPPPDDAQMEEMIEQLLAGNQEKTKLLKENGAADLAYAIPEAGRFRVNAFHSRERYAIVMRRIITKIPNFTDLGLPPQIEELANVHRGIVIVSGTTGSGKSTTLAAVIGKINRTRAERIITVEDPIEFQHENAKSLVSQVEVGQDSISYEYALRAMMRRIRTSS